MGTNEEMYVEEAGLKLKDVFRFIRRSAVRILIYVLTAVIALSVFILALRFIMSDTQTTTTRIEFTYKGIDKGLTPIQTVFDKDSIISVDIVSTAITNAGLTEKLKDISEVKSKLAVIAVPPEEYLKLLADANNDDATAKEALRNNVFYSTKFDVSLIDTGNKLNLTKIESTVFLDKLIAAYKEQFKKDYSTKLTFSTQLFDEDRETYDFLDYYDAYYSEITKTLSYLEILNKEDSSFRSTTTGFSFNSLIANKPLLDSQYSNFMSYILKQAVLKFPEYTINNLTNNINQLNLDLTMYEKQKSSLESQIKSIAQNATIVETSTGTTTYLAYPDTFYILHSNLTLVDKNISLATRQLKMYTDRLTDLSNAVSDQVKEAEANKLLNTVRSDSKKYIEDANSTIVEYMDTIYVKNKMNISQSTVYLTTPADIPYLVIFAVVIVLAIGTAMIVTQVKIVKLRNIAKNTDNTNK